MYTDTKLSLPAETIYDIVTFIVAEYLDDLIFGPISLPRKLAEDTKDPMLSNTNPVHALLAASLQLRHRTLGVVSAALGIPIRKEGIWSLLKSKPWAKIRPVRAFCATPAEFNTPLPPMNNPAPERADMPDVLETYVMLHGANIYMATLLHQVARPLSEGAPPPRPSLTSESCSWVVNTA